MIFSRFFPTYHQELESRHRRISEEAIELDLEQIRINYRIQMLREQQDYLAGLIAKLSPKG